MSLAVSMVTGTERPVDVDGIVKALKVGAKMSVKLAEQFAVVPPPLPLQLQLKEPLPVTVDGVPVIQRLLVGMVATVIPLLVPQVPLTGNAANVGETVQLLVIPPVV